METDFLIEMGYPGLTARLKRLNDQFVYQTKAFYKDKGIEIDPNWHVIFLLLIKHKTMTVTEIADAVHLTHPAIVKLVNKMKKKGYVVSRRDRDDHRKFQLQLSEKAEAELPELRAYWDAGIQAVEEMMNHSKELLRRLEIVENNMREQDFTERMHENYNKKN